VVKKLVGSVAGYDCQKRQDCWRAAYDLLERAIATSSCRKDISLEAAQAALKNCPLSLIMAETARLTDPMRPRVDVNSI